MGPAGPAILIYGVFAIYPLFDVVVMSFQKWNGLDPDRVFVGLDNYRFIFTSDPVFWVAFKNTVIWTIMCLIFPPLVGLAAGAWTEPEPFRSRRATRHILSAGHHCLDRSRHHVALDV